MEPKKELKDYLSHLQTDDIIAATHQARKKSMVILQDQGIAAMAILISDVITEAIENPALLLEKLS